MPHNHSYADSRGPSPLLGNWIRSRASRYTGQEIKGAMEKYVRLFTVTYLSICASIDWYCEYIHLSTIFYQISGITAMFRTNDWLRSLSSRRALIQSVALSLMSNCQSHKVETHKDCHRQYCIETILLGFRPSLVRRSVKACADVKEASE